MSKHAISNEKESVGAIIKKFMHVIGINHQAVQVDPAMQSWKKYNYGGAALCGHCIRLRYLKCISCTGSEGTYHEHGLPAFGESLLQ